MKGVVIGLIITVTTNGDLHVCVEYTKGEVIVVIISVAHIEKRYPRGKMLSKSVYNLDLEI